MNRGAIGAIIGGLLGLVFGPSAFIGVQDLMGWEVDPILGGLPGLVFIPMLAALGFVAAKEQ